jgi:hypothetical protein
MIPPDTRWKNIAENGEAVRQRLVLGKITLPVHSYGGVLAQEMHEKIADSQIVILPKSRRVTFVDQQGCATIRRTYSRICRSPRQR